MNYSDIVSAAHYFESEYLNKVYKVTTFSEKVFWLKAQKRNFAHLIGIKRHEYSRCKYSASNLFDLIYKGIPINSSIIPNNIRSSSLKGRKLLNFQKSHTLFQNSKSLCIHYNSSLSPLKLNHVDILFSDYNSGYSFGWKYTETAALCNCNNADIFNPVSWIDESSGTISDKEKYYSSQTTELIKFIAIYDNYGNEIERNIFTYRFSTIKNILSVTERNLMNLQLKEKKLIFIIISFLLSIHAKINDKIY